MSLKKPDNERPSVVIVMGPAGAGKTTVGRRLADALGWTFLDGDDLHAPEAVDQMRRGVPLTEPQRAPWLDRIRLRSEALIATGQSVVLACSALKQAHRERLRPAGAEVRLVYLKGDYSLLQHRLQTRANHYLKPPLLDSQLASLEEPRAALTLDASLPVDDIVTHIRASFGI